jgi:hypothetical protein
MIITFHYKEDSIPSIRGGRLTDDAIAQIDAVYREAGYAKTLKLGGKTIVLNGKDNIGYVVYYPEERMTGQEWYERFEKELNELGNYGSTSVKVYPSGLFWHRADMVNTAAKRAAGLEQS